LIDGNGLFNFVSINCSGCFLRIAWESASNGGGRGITWSWLIDIWILSIISWTFGKTKSFSSWHNSNRTVGFVFKGVICWPLERFFSMKISFVWWLSMVVSGKIGRKIGDETGVDWGRIPNAVYCCWLSKSKVVEGETKSCLAEFGPLRTA
jgi:hypothetical protein